MPSVSQETLNRTYLDEVSPDDGCEPAGHSEDAGDGEQYED